MSVSRYIRWHDLSLDLKRRILNSTPSTSTTNTSDNVANSIFGSKVYTLGEGGLYTSVTSLVAHINSDFISTGNDNYTIIVLPGEHSISTKIQLMEYNLSIIGFGPDLSTFVNIASSNITMLEKISGRLKLNNLSMYGNASGEGIAATEVSLAGGCLDNLFYNVTFENLYRGWESQNTDITESVFYGCQFIDCNEYGIYWKNRLGNRSWINCCLFYNTASGTSKAIAGGSYTELKINSCYINNYSTGIYCQDTGYIGDTKIHGGDIGVGYEAAAANPPLQVNDLYCTSTKPLKAANSDSVIVITGGYLDESAIDTSGGGTVTGLFYDTDDEEMTYLPNPGGDDEKVKVSSNDTDSGYLDAKITSNGTIDLTEVNDGGDEDLRIGVNFDNTTIGQNISNEIVVKDNGITAAKIGNDVDYSVISGNDGDTDVTALELEELTDGSDTSLHTHSGLTPGAHAASHTDGTDNIRTDGTTVGINGSDELYVPDGGIDTTQLADDSVDKDKIAADVAGDMLAQNVDGSLEVDDDDASIAENAATSKLEVKGFSAADNDRILVKTDDAMDYLSLSSIYGDDNVYVVSPNGYGDYTTIAAALTAASGNTPAADNRMVVWVLPGTYEVDTAIAGQQYVDIMGFNRNTCIIDNTAGAAMDTFNPASDSAISNLTLKGNYTTYNDKAFDIGDVSNLILQNIYMEDYNWGITGSNSTWSNVCGYALHFDDCQGAIKCTSLTDSGVCFRDLKIVESTDNVTEYGVWNNGCDKWKLFNVICKGGMTYAFRCSSNGAELRLYNCEVDGADTNGLLTDGGSSIIRANGCTVLNCGTNDCKTNNISSRIYLSGGEYDESTFSDIGTGGFGSNGITGGFFNLDTDSWDDARTP
jgi:hypothetical protein